MTLHIFGIRHHGPGSARSLLSALTALQPDAVLIEGPPDADKLITLAGHADMQPPVALLVYNPAQPRQAGWYPFAVFSPEWQAIQHALAHAIPVQLMDLPLKHVLALRPEPTTAIEPTTDSDQPGDRGDLLLRLDPLQALAEAAGYADGERWWEHMVEERRPHDPTDTQVFEAILEAMTALRAIAEQSPVSLPGYDEIEARREAWMRKTIRTAAKKYKRLAVVCGAWHAPVLSATPHEGDAELLRGLPSVKTESTWAPWTYGRLSRDSGYGAGIESPGWYQHLWETAEPDVAASWLSRVASLLRAEDLNASPAQVIDAVRLAETLAAIRDRPAPGLGELNEAALAVLCAGDSTPLKLIHQKLVVGETLGSVPAETPMIPLQRDLEATQRRLRLKPSLDERLLDLDLRAPTDLARSHLLHRLSLLNVNWGRRERSQSQALGTFHEYWRVQWQPELTVAVIEAGIWGNTVEDAASGRARAAADDGTTLPALTALVEHVLQADLPAVIDHVMSRLQDQAALTNDVALLMDALPPLVDVMRYGNVRKTDAAMVAQVVDGLVARVCVGLIPACASLDDDAAAAMFTRLNTFNAAVRLLNHAGHINLWHATLDQLASRQSLHGLVSGRAIRLLYDAGVVPQRQVVGYLRRSLSVGTPPLQAAFAIEGFLKGSGAVLLHDEPLWLLLDGWLAAMPTEQFDSVLPLLRRTFATFHAPERRQMGERARRGNQPLPQPAATLNEERAARVLPVLSLLLGDNG